MQVFRLAGPHAPRITKGEVTYAKATLPGYDLAIGTDIVPSILVCTSDEWIRLEEQESIFRDVVERDGVSVR